MPHTLDCFRAAFVSVGQPEYTDEELLASKLDGCSVINAGDGAHEHPTQALLDLYTIFRQRPLDGLSVAIIGELDKGRTARSLAYL